MGSERFQQTRLQLAATEAHTTNKTLGHEVHRPEQLFHKACYHANTKCDLYTTRAFGLYLRAGASDT